MSSHSNPFVTDSIIHCLFMPLVSSLTPALSLCLDVQVRQSRASSVSSHSNPLFTSDPDDMDAHGDIQSAALPTVPEALNESPSKLDGAPAR